MELTDKELIRISETIDMIPPDVSSILEVGCGDGRISENIVTRFRTMGIDINMDRIRTFPGEKVIADVAKLPIKDKHFDMVLAIELLEHLNDKAFHTAINEILRVTRKYILITVPFKEALPAEWLKCSNCGTIFHRWGHERTFNLTDLKKLFSEGAALIDKKWLSPKEPFLPSLLYVFTKKIGNVWEANPAENALCHKCGGSPFQYSGNILGKILIRVVWRVSRFSPFRKPIWVECLYQKSSKS